MTTGPAVTRSWSRQKMMMGLLGAGISIAGVWWALRGVELGAVWASADRIDWPLTAASTALFWVLAVTARSLLIRHLLRGVGEVPVVRAYRYICIGYLANNLLPLRVGELVRIGGLARAAGIGFAAVTGALAVERLLDLLMVAGLGMVAAQVGPLPAELKTTTMLMGLGLLAALGVLIVFSRRSLAEREIPNRLINRAFAFVVRFTKGLGALGSGKDTALALSLMLVIWVATVITFYYRLEAFGIAPTWGLTVVVLTLLSLGVAAPSAPGFLGVYEASIVFGLSLYAVDKSTAVGFAFFSHALDLGLGCLFGAVALTLEGMSFGELRRAGTRSADG